MPKSAAVALVGVAASVWLAHGAVAAPAAPCPADVRKPSASAVVACLRKGPVVLEGAKVRGLVDLRPLESVGHVFVCRSCTLLGGLDGADVAFSHPVDLTGSKIVGPLDMEGAVFQGPFLATGLEARGGPVSFEVAVFDDLAGFDGVVFTRSATFARARFRSDVTFAGTAFLDRRAGLEDFAGAQGQVSSCRPRSGWVRADAVFTAARFAGPASFANTCVLGSLHVDQASFADAVGFNGAVVKGFADFGGVVFSGRTDFTNFRVDWRASFDDAQFARGAIFLGANFFSHGQSVSADRKYTYEPAVTFEQIGDEGLLDLTFAGLATDGGPPPPDRQSCPDGRTALISFSGTIAALDLSNLDLPDGFGIAFGTDTNKLSLGSLKLAVPATGDVVDCFGDRSNQLNALTTISATAKSHGDLGLANDAHYRYETLVTAHYDWWRRLPAEYLYGWVGGYLVRPLQPLLALLFLALLVTAWRVARRRRRALRRIHTRRGKVARVINEFLDTLLLLGPKKWGGSDGRSLSQRLESYAYRILLACALFALAASNPTLRQLVDAVF